MKKLISFLVCVCMYANVHAQSVEKQLKGKWRLASVKTNTEFTDSAFALEDVKKAQVAWGKFEGMIFDFKVDNKYELDGKPQKGLYRFSDEKLYLEISENELKGIPIADKKAISFTFPVGMAKVTFLYDKKLKKKK